MPSDLHAIEAKIGSNLLSGHLDEVVDAVLVLAVEVVVLMRPQQTWMGFSH